MVFLSVFSDPELPALLQVSPAGEGSHCPAYAGDGYVPVPVAGKPYISDLKGGEALARVIPEYLEDPAILGPGPYLPFLQFLFCEARRRKVNIELAGHSAMYIGFGILYSLSPCSAEASQLLIPEISGLFSHLMA